MFLNLLTKFFLGNICIRKSYIVNLSLHLLKIEQGMMKNTENISYMDVVAFEVALKQNNKVVIHSTVSKVIHK